MTNWDTETADKCRLPELIPSICDRCRDEAYCYRQMAMPLPEPPKEDKT